MRLIVRSVLILLYSLFILANLYSIVMGGFSFTRGIFLALSILAIVALTGKGGSNTRFLAYVLCGLLGFAGVLFTGYSVWIYTRNVPTGAVILWAGPILVFVAATTFWVLKTGKQREPVRATDLETR